MIFFIFCIKTFDNFFPWYYNNGGIPTKQVGIKQNAHVINGAGIKTNPVNKNNYG